MSRLFSLMIFISLTSSTMSSSAAETITFKNGTNQIQTIWIWPVALKKYLDPPITVPPGNVKQVTFNSGEEYYLVTTDENGRHVALGRFNFTELRKAHPELFLALKPNSLASTNYYSEGDKPHKSEPPLYTLEPIDTPARGRSRRR